MEVTDFQSILSVIGSGESVQVDGSLVTVVKEALGPSYAEVPRVKVLEAVATLLRDGDFRAVAQKEDFIYLALPFLIGDRTLQFHTLRIIGNLCYENDAVRDALLKSGHLKEVVVLLQSWAGLPDEADNAKLKTVACGCILNICCYNETLSKEVCQMGVLLGIAEILHSSSSDEAIAMALKCLSAILESYAPVGSLFIESKGDEVIIKLLQRLNKMEVNGEELLETTHALVENNDQWKIALCKQGCVRMLLELGDEDLLQKAADIVVLILSEDSSVEVLMKEGYLLQVAKQWMQNSERGYQQANGALFVANLARNDANCKVLIESEVVPLLTYLLQKDPLDDFFIRISQSALSVLRNLAIPAENKRLLHGAGVTDLALKHLHTPSPVVQFKALGVLRLLADKQAEICDTVSGSLKDLRQICYLCSLGSHLESEGSRLLATLIKHSKDPGSTCNIVCECDGTKWLVNLLQSGHAVMINEGILALVIIASQKNKDFVGKLRETDLVEVILKLSGKEELSAEVMCNLLTLLLHLLQEDFFRQCIVEKATSLNITFDRLEKINNAAITERISQLRKIIQK